MQPVNSLPHFTDFPYHERIDISCPYCGDTYNHLVRVAAIEVALSIC